MASARDYLPFLDGASVSATTLEAAQTIFTVPANHDAVIEHLAASNLTGSTSNVSVTVYSARKDTCVCTVREHTLAGNTYLNIVDGNRLFLSAGDEVRAWVGSADDAIVTVSGRLLYSPTRN